jgi:hypothetical protein
LFIETHAEWGTHHPYPAPSGLAESESWATDVKKDCFGERFGYRFN